MRSTERHSPTSRHYGRDLRRRRTRRADVARCVSFLCLVIGLFGIPASATTQQASADHGQRIVASSGVTGGHANDVVHGHKEGPLAVAFSVIGVIVIVVFIVGLGSLSVRRRTRDRPPREPRGPREPLIGREDCSDERPGFSEEGGSGSVGGRSRSGTG